MGTQSTWGFFRSPKKTYEKNIMKSVIAFLAFVAAASAQTWPMVTVDTSGNIVLQSTTKTKAFKLITTAVTPQATAAAIGGVSHATVAASASTVGVTLPAAEAGFRVTVTKSASTGAFNLYALSGDQINNSASTTAFAVKATDLLVTCEAYDATNWLCESRDKYGGASGSVFVTSTLTPPTRTSTSPRVSPTASTTSSSASPPPSPTSSPPPSARALAPPPLPSPTASPPRSVTSSGTPPTPTSTSPAAPPTARTGPVSRTGTGLPPPLTPLPSPSSPRPRLVTSSGTPSPPPPSSSPSGPSSVPPPAPWALPPLVPSPPSSTLKWCWNQQK